MGSKIFDPGVEYVLEAVFAHEQIGEDPDASQNGVFLVVVPPNQLQVVDGIHPSLVVFHLPQQILHRELGLSEDGGYFVDMFEHVPLHKTQHRFSIVFRDVFRFILIVIIRRRSYYRLYK